MTTHLVPFEKFLHRPTTIARRTAEIQAAGLSGYFRKCVHASRQADIEIAMIFADDPGKGALTAFLDKYEPFCRFYFESVVNERLVHYLRRRGYQIVDGSRCVDREPNGLEIGVDLRKPTEQELAGAHALPEELQKAQDDLFRQILQNSTEANSRRG